jgi:hypothetical protein
MRRSICAAVESPLNERQPMKTVASLESDPFLVNLTDRAVSVFVDPQSGDIFLDEGRGADRMNGAVFPPDDGARFRLYDDAAGSDARLAIRCDHTDYDLGDLSLVPTAAAWVREVNEFLDSKATRCGNAAQAPAATNGQSMESEVPWKTNQVAS